MKDLLFLTIVGVGSWIGYTFYKMEYNPARYNDMSRIEAPFGAVEAWNDIRKCSENNEDKFNSLKWYVTEEIKEPFNMTLNEPSRNGNKMVAVYVKPHNAIILTSDIIRRDPTDDIRKMIVRHELMHVREYKKMHDPMFFNLYCGTNW